MDILDINGGASGGPQNSPKITKKWLLKGINEKNVQKFIVKIHFKAGSNGGSKPTLISKNMLFWRI